MYLVIYPTDSIFERHEFDNYNTNVPEQAKEVFKQLYNALHNWYSFKFYDMSSVSNDTKYANLDNFVEDCNDELVSIESSWTIWLNLSEEDITSVIEEYEQEKKKQAV